MIRYARRHEIPLTREQANQFRTYRNFFLRQRDDLQIDPDPDHFISPCDSLLSAYTIDENSSFSIKGSRYRICDLLEDESLAKKYEGGICLIFRLCASDYHHYCYIDDGTREKYVTVNGVLHTVNPIACKKVKVYSENHREYTTLHLKNFGDVVQIEVGALMVGKIKNNDIETFKRGDEKGYFEFGGSTIIMLFKENTIKIDDDILSQSANEIETRVKYGETIGRSS